MTEQQIAELIDLAAGGHQDLEEAGQCVPRLLEERRRLLEALNNTLDGLQATCAYETKDLRIAEEALAFAEEESK